MCKLLGYLNKLSGAISQTSYIEDFVTRQCAPLANEIAAHLSNGRIVGCHRESHENDNKQLGTDSTMLC